MKVDVYTKVVLSVIATCLVWLCLNGVIPGVSAQAGPSRPTPVLLVDERGAPLANAQGLRVNVSNPAVPVVIGNQTLSVALTSIERRGTWQPIEVDVTKTPPTAMPVP
jgi:hypothetical protein